MLTPVGAPRRKSLNSGICKLCDKATAARECGSVEGNDCGAAAAGTLAEHAEDYQVSALIWAGRMSGGSRSFAHCSGPASPGQRSAKSGSAAAACTELFLRPDIQASRIFDETARKQIQKRTSLYGQGSGMSAFERELPTMLRSQQFHTRTLTGWKTRDVAAEAVLVHYDWVPCVARGATFAVMHGRCLRLL